MEYCKDHQECRDSAVKLQAEFNAVKKDGHSKLKDLADEVEDVWFELKNKLTAKAFTWVVSGLVFILVVVMSVQWKLLNKIDDKVDNIAINQAVIASKLKVELKK